jgi:hypothetical protein
VAPGQYAGLSHDRPYLSGRVAGGDHRVGFRQLPRLGQAWRREDDEAAQVVPVVGAVEQRPVESYGAEVPEPGEVREMSRLKRVQLR